MLCKFPLQYGDYSYNLFYLITLNKNEEPDFEFILSCKLHYFSFNIVKWNKRKILGLINAVRL